MIGGKIDPYNKLRVMKSYFLERIGSLDTAKAALRSRLPGQESPWLLLSSSGDPIAYFNVESHLGGAPLLNVQADISGRHHNEDAAVIAVLKDIQRVAGGVVTNDA
jgi:hypothetical protein